MTLWQLNLNKYDFICNTYENNENMLCWVFCNQWNEDKITISVSVLILLELWPFAKRKVGKYIPENDTNIEPTPKWMKWSELFKPTRAKHHKCIKSTYYAQNKRDINLKYRLKMDVLVFVTTISVKFLNIDTLHFNCQFLSQIIRYMLCLPISSENGSIAFKMSEK